MSNSYTILQAFWLPLIVAGANVVFLAAYIRNRRRAIATGAPMAAPLGVSYALSMTMLLGFTVYLGVVKLREYDWHAQPLVSMNDTQSISSVLRVREATHAGRIATFRLFQEPGLPAREFEVSYQGLSLSVPPTPGIVTNVTGLLAPMVYGFNRLPVQIVSGTNTLTTAGEFTFAFAFDDVRQAAMAAEQVRKLYGNMPIHWGKDSALLLFSLRRKIDSKKWETIQSSIILKRSRTDSVLIIDPAPPVFPP